MVYDRTSIINELFELANTTDDARTAKEILNNFNGSRDEIYCLYDIFESSRDFGYIQTKLARL